MSDKLRSLLFVPASRPERFAKALASGADAVIIDLEDAVEPDKKDTARQSIRQFADENPQARFYVRINDSESPWFDADLSLCAELPGVRGIVLPKAESGEQIWQLEGSKKPVVPLVESAQGVLAMSDIAAAPGVERLTFGALDFLLDLAATPGTAAGQLLLNHVRCQVLLNSSAQALQAPIDTIYPDFRDLQGLSDAARQSRDMGFAGMLCIHPSQVAVVHEVYAPSAEALSWARRVVHAADASGSSAFKLDGQMIDKPVIERARRLLARAD